MAAILVVEDEVDLCNLIRTKLEAEGHSVLQALDGLAVCRQLRQHHLMPIIMLTARNEEIDRVLGLEVGADDYISKPFSIRELLARVRAVLRRVELDSRSLPTTSAPLVRGALCIYELERVVTLDGVELDLTPKEYELLLLLASHPGRAFSREFLLQHLWGYDYDGFDRTVDTHMTRLRKKLGTVGEKIVTVWGVGYRFVV